MEKGVGVKTAEGCKSGEGPPLFLGERLLPHGQVLLVLHQSDERRAGLDPQAVVVVLRITPGTNTHTHRGHQTDISKPVFVAVGA